MNFTFWIVDSRNRVKMDFFIGSETFSSKTFSSKGVSICCKFISLLNSTIARGSSIKIFVSSISIIVRISREFCIHIVVSCKSILFFVSCIFILGFNQFYHICKSKSKIDSSYWTFNRTLVSFCWTSRIFFVFLSNPKVRVLIIT